MTQLIEVISEDNLILPGLLFENNNHDQLAIWLHGTGDNGVFYKTKLINALAKELNDHHISFLAFNNRGAHDRKYLKNNLNPNQSFLGGWTNEIIKDCIYDINGAINLAKQLHYSQLYLIGHSTGANKIVLYHFKNQKNSPFKKYILLGPGDDTGLQALSNEKQFLYNLQLAQKYLTQNRYFKIMPKYSHLYPMSTQSAFDMLNPDGDYNIFPYFEVMYHRLGHKKLFQELNSIDRPTLIIYGQNDEYLINYSGVNMVKKIIKQNLSPSTLSRITFKIIEGSDHSFHDHEYVLAREISRWI